MYIYVNINVDDHLHLDFPEATQGKSLKASSSFGLHKGQVRERKRLTG